MRLNEPRRRSTQARRRGRWTPGGLASHCASMLTLVQPSPQLRPYVSGYLCVRDIDDAHRGRPIETAPRRRGSHRQRRTTEQHGARRANPCALAVGVSRSRARSWRSGADTYFAMALLTPSGLARLMPGCGSGTADALIDFGGAGKGPGGKSHPRGRRGAARRDGHSGRPRRLAAGTADGRCCIAIRRPLRRRVPRARPRVMRRGDGKDAWCDAASSIAPRY